METKDESKTLEIINPEGVDTLEIVPFGTDQAIKLSIKIVREMIAVPTKSGKKPDDTQCINFMMLCRAKHLNPFEKDCYLLGYDTQSGPQFSQITAHQVFLKRAEASKSFKGLQSGVIVVNQAADTIEREGDLVYVGEKLIGGWAKVYKKELEHPFYKRLKLETFSTGQSRWLKDPAGMIVKCAEADALRSCFPTHLGGLNISEELPPIDVTPVIKPAKIPRSEFTKLMGKSERIETAEQEGKRLREELDKRVDGKTAAESSEQGESDTHVHNPSQEPAPTVPPSEKKSVETDSQSSDEKKTPVGDQPGVLRPGVSETESSPTTLKPKAKKNAPSDLPEMDHRAVLTIELSNRLNSVDFTAEQFLNVCRENEWIEQDEDWPLSEKRLTKLLKEENWKVVVKEMSVGRL